MILWVDIDRFRVVSANLGRQLGGVAVQSALAAALRTFGARSVRGLALGGAALALCALPPLLETRRSHPFGLSHYNVVAGGTPGAADLGLCRQFWGFTTGSLVPWLNRTVTRRGAVQFHDTTHQAVRMLQRDGRLRTDIRIAPTAEPIWTFQRTHSSVPAGSSADEVDVSIIPFRFVSTHRPLSPAILVTLPSMSVAPPMNRAPPEVLTFPRLAT